jgi:hypothetical protein
MARMMNTTTRPRTAALRATLPEVTSLVLRGLLDGGVFAIGLDVATNIAPITAHIPEAIR